MNPIETAKKRSGGTACWLLMLSLVLLCPRTLAAQDQPPDSTSQDSSESATASQSTDQDSSQSTTTVPSAESEPDPFADQTTTTTLDTGQPIDHNSSNRISALQWGHLALLSADAFYGHDSNYKFAPSNPQTSDAFAARLLALYSIGNEHSGLDVQYRPLVFVSGSEDQIDLLGGQFNLHSYRRLSSRWMLSLLELFSYLPDRGGFIEATINPSLSTGQIQQQSFLANGANELRNGASGSLAYRLSLNDSVGFHAQYQFVDLTNEFKSDQSTPSEFGTTNTFGGGLNWTHLLNTYHDIGVDFTYDRQYVYGFETGTNFYNVLVTYRQWITPTLRLRVQIGPSWRMGTDGVPERKTVIGSLAIIKIFHQSQLSGLYARDYYYTGVISNSYHDRFDGLYSRNFGPRWAISGGGGYLINNSSITPQVRSRNLWVRGTHLLSPSWSLYVSFSNSAATGGQPFENRHFLAAGLHWSPAHE